MKVEPVQALTLEGETIDVNTLSEPIQRLVDIYNDWRQQETDARIEMLKCQAALRDITREILTMIQKDKQESATNTAPEAEQPAEA